MYDAKHRYNVISTLEDRPRPFEQKGFTEKLLCDACEQQLSTYENYSRGVIKGGGTLTVTRQPGRIGISGIDYDKFKLFQLSIIWRAGISNHQLFSRVKLGPHEACLREMLRTENPGRSTNYTCLIFGLTAKKSPIPNFIDQPARLRLDGMICYRFIFCGLVWVFFVTSHGPSQLVRQHALSEEGELIIWIKPFEDLGYLMDFMSDVDQMGRLPN